MSKVLSTLLLDIAIIVLIFILGSQVVQLLRTSTSRFEILYLAFPIGSGIFSWLLFLTSWAGVPLRLITIIILYLLIMVSILLVRMRRQGSLGLPRGDGVRTCVGDGSWKRLLLILSVLVIVIAMVWLVLIAVGRAYSSWDAAAIWAIKGYAIAYEESISGGSWGAFGFSYPLNIPITISLFRTADLDILPGSKIIFPLFYFSLMLGCYEFLSRNGVRLLIAAIGTLVLASVPIIFQHATIGYVNLPLTCYLVLGSLMGIQGVFEDDPGAQTISGVLLGLGAWTRREGVLYALAIILAITVAKLITKHGKIHPLRWLLPVAAISGTWLVFYFSTTAGQDVAATSLSATAEDILHGDINIQVLRYIFGYSRRNILKISIWGILFPLSFLVLVLNWRLELLKLYPKFVAMLFVLIGITSVTVTLYYVGSNEISNLIVWLQQSFDREFFPSAMILGVLALLSTVKIQNESQAEDHA